MILSTNECDGDIQLYFRRDEVKLVRPDPAHLESHSHPHGVDYTPRVFGSQSLSGRNGWLRVHLHFSESECGVASPHFRGAVIGGGCVRRILWLLASDLLRMHYDWLSETTAYRGLAAVKSCMGKFHWFYLAPIRRPRVFPQLTVLHATSVLGYPSSAILHDFPWTCKPRIPLWPKMVADKTENIASRILDLPHFPAMVQ